MHLSSFVLTLLVCSVYAPASSCTRYVCTISYAYPFVASHSLAHMFASHAIPFTISVRQTTGVSVAYRDRVYLSKSGRVPWVKFTIYSVVEIGRERIALLLLRSKTIIKKWISSTLHYSTSRTRASTTTTAATTKITFTSVYFVKFWDFLLLFRRIVWEVVCSSSKRLNEWARLS